MVNLRGYHYPLDHYLYDAFGRCIHITTTWTWWQMPEIPWEVQMLASEIETRNALGLTVKRTDLSPVVVA